MLFHNVILKLLDQKTEEYEKFHLVYQRVLKRNDTEILSIPDGLGSHKTITYYPVVYSYEGRKGKIGILGSGKIISPRRYPNHSQFVYINDSNNRRRSNEISSTFDEKWMFFGEKSYVEAVSKENFDFLKLLLKSNMSNSFWQKRNSGNISRAYHGGRSGLIYDYRILISQDKRMSFKNILSHFLGGETFLNFPVSEHTGSTDYYISSFLGEVSEKYLKSLSDEELVSLDLSKLCLVDLIKDHLIITKLEGISEG